MRFFEFQQIKPNPISAEMWQGTNARFDRFDQRMARVQNDLYGGGVGYFTDSLEVAKGYATSSLKRKGVPIDSTPYIYKVNLTLDNVFDVGKTYDGDFVSSFLKNTDYGTAEQFLRNAGLAKMGSDLAGNIGNLRRGELQMSGDQIFNAIGEQSKNSSKARDILIKRGFDGLTHPGGLRGGTKGLHTVIIAYDSDKIQILERYKLKT